MNYLKFPLQYQLSGAVVEVILSGDECDVFLVDSSNLAYFERGSQFRYFGGHFKASPAILEVPSPGTWTAVVVPSPSGTVRASARVFAPA